MFINDEDLKILSYADSIIIGWPYQSHSRARANLGLDDFRSKA